MAIRTNLIDGKVINSDTHFSKYIETVSEPGVIEGMAVTSGKVGIGKCWCPCIRNNNESVYAYVENFSEITIDTSGTGFVIVTIPQSMIDDGSLINEDGTGVASVEVVAELPEKNYLKLASINNGTITDERNIIKKVGELNMAIESLISRVDGIDERVQELEEAGAIDHLEEQALVGELYNSTSQSMFRQLTPTNANSTVEDCHVGDVAANTEIHIQRIAEGVESNQLKLKAKMVGSPTTNLKVEVRKGVQVNVSTTEAYWYGDSSEVLASGTLAYTSFSTSWAEVTFNLNNAISVDKGTLLDVVVYQESGGTKVVNSTNYYILACDSTQWSEAFSFVSVNGSTRSRSKLMPYCISDSFAQSLLSKVSTGTVSGLSVVSHSAAMSDWNGTSAVNDSTPGRGYVYSNNNPQTAQTLSITNPLVDYRVRIANAGLLVTLNGTVVHGSTPRGGARDTGVKDGGKTTNNTLVVQACDGSYGGSYFLSRVDYNTLDTLSISGKTGHKLVPKEVKGLGKELYVISFGRLPNGQRWTGE